jgi:hypothetical protein
MVPDSRDSATNRCPCPCVLRSDALPQNPQQITSQLIRLDLPRSAGCRSLSLGRFVECEPLDWLTGYICDELEVLVVVQDSELGQLGGGGD